MSKCTFYLFLFFYTRWRCLRASANTEFFFFFVFSFLFFCAEYTRKCTDNPEFTVKTCLLLQSSKNYYFRLYRYVLVLHLAQRFNDFDSGSAKWKWARKAKGWEQWITAIPLYWIWIIRDVNAYRKEKEGLETHTQKVPQKKRRKIAHIVCMTMSL